jgi:hypothetical protein
MANHSENINEIAKALANAQKELPNPKKGKSGHNYKYAELDTCMDILKEILPKHGLSITQPILYIDGKIGVQTILMHSSGQWISSFLPLDTEGGMKMSGMQKVGSAITYARRYSLSITGLAPEEDDDNQISRPVLNQNQQRPQTPNQAPMRNQNQQRPNQNQQRPMQNQNQQRLPTGQQTNVNYTTTDIPFDDLGPQKGVGPLRTDRF